MELQPTGFDCGVRDYHVDLNAVGVLELTVNPDVARRGALASLDELRIA